MPGAGFIPIKLDNERNNVRKKSVLFLQKTFKTIYRNGFNSTPIDISIFDP